jgi:hypothetical protein
LESGVGDLFKVPPELCLAAEPTNEEPEDSVKNDLKYVIEITTLLSYILVEYALLQIQSKIIQPLWQRKYE